VTLDLRQVRCFVAVAVPALLDRLTARHPQLKVEAREVFAEDIPRLLTTDVCDLALAPATIYPPAELSQQLIRLEPLQLAVSEGHKLSDRTAVALDTLHDEQFEVWPREMVPGYYDAVVGACRAAGFEPRLDEHGAGSTVWGYKRRDAGSAWSSSRYASSCRAGYGCSISGRRSRRRSASQPSG